MTAAERFAGRVWLALGIVGLVATATAYIITGQHLVLTAALPAAISTAAGAQRLTSNFRSIR